MAETKSIKIEKGVPMIMRDGISLRADIYRPGDRQRHPGAPDAQPVSQGYDYGF